MNRETVIQNLTVAVRDLRTAVTALPVEALVGHVASELPGDEGTQELSNAIHEVETAAYALDPSRWPGAPARSQVALPPSVLAPDNYSYRERDWRAPKVSEDEEIVFDEPGRVLGRKDPNTSSGGVDCRSHYFRVTKAKFGGYQLRVHHGGGEEHWRLDYDKRTVEALGQMDSDARYRLLWVIMEAHHTSASRATEAANERWQRAAAERRIKTRRLPSQGKTKVWIEEKS